MRATKVWVSTVLMVVLTLPGVSHAAGIAVFDANAAAQWMLSLKGQVEQYAAQLKQIQNEVMMIHNQATQIQHLYTTVQHGVTNLASLRLNNAADLLTLVNQLEGKLNQAQYIGYQVGNAVSQAQNVYPRLQHVLSAQDWQTLNLQWAAVKRNSAEVAIATQAIQSAQTQVKQKWGEVLHAAQAAQGNLQIQQAAVQAQGLVGSQLLSIEQHLATQARQESERRMEEASRTEATQALLEHITGTRETLYTISGRKQIMPSLGTE